MLAGQLVNLTLSAIVFLATARLGRTFFSDPRCGRLAVLLLAVYPNHVAFIPLLWAELFYATLVMLGGLLLTLRSRTAAIAAGIVFGVAALTKAQSLIVPLFLISCAWLANPTRPAFRQLARTGLIVHLVMILVVTPWTMRNYLVFHAFVPVSTNGGPTLLSGNNPEATGDFSPNPSLWKGLHFDARHQVEFDRATRQRALEWMRANPSKVLRLLPLKVWRLWAPDGESEWGYQAGYAAYGTYHLLFRIIRVLNQGYYVLLLLLAVPSLWRVWRLGEGEVLTPWAVSGVALCAYFTLISLVFAGESRFHFALMLWVTIYSAWTLSRILARRAARFVALAPA